MKTRGWLLLAVMVLSTQCAMAASSSDQLFGLTPPAPGDPVLAAQQQTIAAGYALVVGGDVAQTQLITSSKGTLLTAINEVGQLPAPAHVKNAVDGLLTSASNGDAGSLTVLSGVSATATVNAATATTMAIGGGGGVIAGRQSGLMAERKAIGNVDNALASFRMNQNFANRIWASPFYTRQGMDQKDGYSGYDYSAWGASFGYDHVFGPFVAGASFTYSRGDFDADLIADDNTTDNYGFSLYGQYYNTENGVFVTLAGGYNYGDNETRINAGGIFSSDSDTDSYWFGANVGKDIFVNENWTFTPSVGLFWSQSEGSSYTERFNGAAFRNFREMTSESLITPIDIKAEYTTMIDDCSSLSFNISGGYAYNWKSDSGRAEGSFNYVGTGTNVFIQGVEPGRSSWNIGTGLTYRRNNFDVGLNYRYDARSKFDGHRVAATVGWNF